MQEQRRDCQRRSDYSRTNRRDRHVVPIIRAFVRECLTAYPATSSGSLAFDIGCGEQPFRADILGAGYRYASMDVVQNTAKTVDYLGAIDAPLSDALQNAGQAQLVLCTEVLEHVADWQMAFSNLRALCAHGAICIISCPFIWELHEEPHDFWRPTPHAFRFLAKRSNFECIKIAKGGTTAEVLSTALGSIRIVSGSGPLSAGRRLILALFRAALQRLTMSRGVALLGSLESDMYLSNLVVLKAL